MIMLQFASRTDCLASLLVKLMLSWGLRERMMVRTLEPRGGEMPSILDKKGFI
jgi:hypothetical protein